MADVYRVGIVPQEYDPAWMESELQRISGMLQELEIPLVTITITYVAPFRTREGMVVNADGVQWNPGAGAGLYQYLSGAWVKL